MTHTLTAEKLKQRIEADLAQLRLVAEEPISIQLTDVIDMEVRPKDDDDRVLVGRTGWGYTIVNYTSEGLIVDVIAQDELEPVHTAALLSSDLTQEED